MIDREDGHHLEPEDLAMMVSRGDGMTFKERQMAAKLIRSHIPHDVPRDDWRRYSCPSCETRYRCPICEGTPT